VTNRRTVVVVGAGGNIGSHLVPHLARLPTIGRLVLIDRDRYEARNGANQAFDRRAVGHWKAEVQAREARRIAANMEVVPLAEDVERLPLGVLRADVVLSCVDTRRARLFINEAVWRLGVPWIDAGVLADGSLVRVTAFVPRPDHPCLECGWSDADYAALEQAYPCGPTPSAPTGAPAELGALAASLQALECRKLLSSNPPEQLPGDEIVIDCAHHVQYVTAFRRNPSCLFDHATWSVMSLEVEPWLASIRDMLALANGAAPAERRLRVSGATFVRQLTCGNCGAGRETLRMSTRLDPEMLRCRECGGALVATGHGLTDSISLAELGDRATDRSLHSIGCRVGDVIAVGNGGGERYFELTGPHRGATASARLEASAHDS